jgi:hypothetical protein
MGKKQTHMVATLGKRNNSLNQLVLPSLIQQLVQLQGTLLQQIQGY